MTRTEIRIPHPLSAKVNRKKIVEIIYGSCFGVDAHGGSPVMLDKSNVEGLVDGMLNGNISRITVYADYYITLKVKLFEVGVIAKATVDPSGVTNSVGGVSTLESTTKAKKLMENLDDLVNVLRNEGRDEDADVLVLQGRIIADMFDEKG